MPALRVRRRLIPLIAGAVSLIAAVAVSAGAHAPARAATGAVTSVTHAYHPGTAGTPSREIASYRAPRLFVKLFPVGAPGMEPTIGVAADGTVYYGAASLVID